MLKSFHIKNYRNLKSVSVNELAEVNLLVGLNNVGKTSFLEAVNLYTSKYTLGVLDSILERRGHHFRKDSDEMTINIIYEILSSFFYKKEKNICEEEGISLFNSDFEELNIKLQPNESASTSSGATLLGNLGLDISIKRGDKHNIYSLEYYSKYSFLTNSNSENRTIYVSSINSSYQELGTYWDKHIYLTEKESDVISALQIIEPNLEKIGFKGDLARSVEIKLKSDKQLYSLNDMGDGMNRILSIIISIIYAENGTLLIDEFENGLHYTAQYQLWKMIFTLSLKLHVQVFVTTHSSDCINAFESVLNSGFSENGKVLRLENKKGEISVQSFDSKEMEIVTQNDVEIR